MSSFSFRDTEGAQAHTGGRRVVDEGDYRVMISKADLEDSKKGGGAVNLAMEYTILAGAFAGSVLKEWLSVINKSETAQNIARSKAEALRVITKIKQDADVSALVGKEIIIRVMREANEYIGNDGQKRTGVNAVVVNYMGLDGKNALGQSVPPFIASVKQEVTTTSTSQNTNSQAQSSRSADLDDEIPFDLR